MNKTILTAFLFAVSGHAMLAQSSQKTQESQPTLQQAIDALAGTYELRPRTDTRMSSTLPSNLAEIIEKNRKDSEDVVVHLNDMVDVLIYSKQRIQTKK